ncbi:hypothetical protein PIB30_076772 [Stylosanthes scabra]|uniref:Uncharacterized protein n=1 Tax=Stylosanthes scabra TaxID=79078 RepID=A0ABU6SRL5_9FABA|nr:hypothetical protein [Stylosanthes scabra]
MTVDGCLYALLGKNRGLQIGQLHRWMKKQLKKSPVLQVFLIELPPALLTPRRRRHIPSPSGAKKKIRLVEETNFETPTRSEKVKVIANREATKRNVENTTP